MVCAVHKSALGKFRPNPNQQVQLNKLFINRIHKPQTAIKMHLVTHSGFQIAQTVTEDVPAACHSIFQGVRAAWCTPRFCTSTEFTCNFSLQDTPSPSIQAQLQEPLCHSAFAPLTWESLRSIVSEVSLKILLFTYFTNYPLTSWFPLMCLFSPFPFFHNIYLSILRILPVCVIFLFFCNFFLVFPQFRVHSLPLSLLLCVMIFCIYDSCGLHG